MTMMTVKSVLTLRSSTPHLPRSQPSKCNILSLSVEMNNNRSSSSLQMLIRLRRLSSSISSSRTRRNPTQAIATEREVETPRMSKDKKEASKVMADNVIDKTGSLTNKERIDPERRDHPERKST